MSAALGGSWKARSLLCLATPPGRGARTSSTCTLDPSAFSAPPAARGRGARPVGAFERGAPRTGQRALGGPGFLANPERRLNRGAPRPPKGAPGSAAPGKGARPHCPPAREEFQLPRAPPWGGLLLNRGNSGEVTQKGQGKASLWLGALCSCSEVRSSLVVAGSHRFFPWESKNIPFRLSFFILRLGAFPPAFQT